MFLRWFFLFISFILCFLGLEIYRNTALMDRGYLLQKLKIRKEKLMQENGYLTEELSSRLSLNRLESYAREELDLVNPEKVRFLEENFSPPEKSSSPPPILTEVKVKLRGWILRTIERVRGWFDILYEEKKK